MIEKRAELSQMVTYLFVIIDAIAQRVLEVKFRWWQKMLLSLRSNPQTKSPYIQKSNDLYTRTDHYILLPIVLHMVVPLCSKIQ